MGHPLHHAVAQRSFNPQLGGALKLRSGHHQRIFPVIVVIPNTTPNLREAERLIEPLSV